MITAMITRPYIYHGTSNILEVNNNRQFVGWVLTIKSGAINSLLIVIWHNFGNIIKHDWITFID